MQTIKALTALAVVAAVVFAVAGTNDIKSQAKYAAGELRNPRMVKTPARTSVQVAGSMKIGGTAPNAGGNFVNTATNAANQARRRIPRT